MFYAFITEIRQLRQSICRWNLFPISLTYIKLLIFCCNFSYNSLYTRIFISKWEFSLILFFCYSLATIFGVNEYRSSPRPYWSRQTVRHAIYTRLSPDALALHLARFPQLWNGCFRIIRPDINKINKWVFV